MQTFKQYFTENTNDVITHGTWVDKLESILDNGLKPGSALDYGITWSSEYPVTLLLDNVIKGQYISHNKYYVSANSPDIKSITVSMQNEEDSGEIADAVKNHHDIPLYVNHDGKWVKTVGAQYDIYHGTGGEEVVDPFGWNFKTKWHDGDFYAIELFGGALYGEDKNNLPIYDNLEDAESFVIQNSVQIQTKGPYAPELKTYNENI